LDTDDTETARTNTDNHFNVLVRGLRAVAVSSVCNDAEEP